MKLPTLALTLTLATHSAIAQELVPLGVYETQLFCYAPQDLMGISAAYGEKPLFVGFATIDSLDLEGNPASLQGPMLFMVNQDTGTWANYIFSPSGAVCSIALGAGFEPYTE